MSSSVDQLPHQPDPNGSSRADASGAVGANAGFSDLFAAEVRSLLGASKPRGTVRAGVATPEVPVETVEVPKAPEPEPGEADLTVRRPLAAPEIAVPAVETEDKPSIGLFLPRVEDAPPRPAPSLTGLSVPVEKAEPAPIPNLFVSSGAAPAEVAFVPAEEIEPNRYRWVLILIGLLLVGGAAWLTWAAAQSGDTVDAPVTTVDTVPTTAATTEAPASTTVSTTAAPTTAAPTTTPSTSATTVASTVAAPAPQATTPRRPATTARPATTSAPTTTAAPVTVPEVTFAPPTWSPATTAAAPVDPPPAADPPAADSPPEG